MFVVEGMKGTGKTKILAKYIHDKKVDKGFLVCANTTKMIEKLYTWGYKDVRVISYKDFLELDPLIKSENEYYIDNINKFFSYLMIDGYTYNWKEDEIPNDAKRRIK